MNYRHAFHAGNFADVMKHVLLVRLLRAVQVKDKGFLYLDTHAGRAFYDLERAATGDSLARTPEWPQGIGRIWKRAALPPHVAEYVDLVRDFDRRRGNLGEAVRFYPGSPWLARLLMRRQDRMALCEQHPDECAALRAEFRDAGRASVHQVDGYIAVRSMLPPPERRALVLIDPPFESQQEFANIVRAVEQGLQRHAATVLALWYPLTERARVDEFFGSLRNLPLPPTLVAELLIAGEQAPLKMRGCGLVVINPPWQFDRAVESLLGFLAETLAQEEGAGGRIEWLVPER